MKVEYTFINIYIVKFPGDPIPDYPDASLMRVFEDEVSAYAYAGMNAGMKVYKYGIDKMVEGNPEK